MLAVWRSRQVDLCVPRPSFKQTSPHFSSTSATNTNTRWRLRNRRLNVDLDDLFLDRCIYTHVRQVRRNQPYYGALPAAHGSSQRPTSAQSRRSPAGETRGGEGGAPSSKVSRHAEISADERPDDIRLSDLEPLFSCQACGKTGRCQAGYK